MRVVLGGRARRDLTEIGDHIALDNPLRAATFVDELEDRCWSLDQYPERFPVVGKLGNRQVRKLTHIGYVILYVVGNDRIDVVRIVNGSRDWFELVNG